MVYINEKEYQVHISLKGCEGDYVATLQALTLALMQMNEKSERNEEARAYLGDLLLEMLPDEGQVTLKQIKSVS
ncbi:MAG TPA: hypothetical protein VF623_05770 [Segetibacter sp.]|jgi:hypothetical protein